MIIRSVWDAAAFFATTAVLIAVGIAMIAGLRAFGLPVHLWIVAPPAIAAAAVPYYWLGIRIPDRRKRERRARAEAAALALANTPLRNEAKLPDGGRTDFDPRLVYQNGAMTYAMDPERRLLRVIHGSEYGTGDILVPLSMLVSVAAYAKDPTPRKRARRTDGPTLLLTFTEEGKDHDFKLHFAPDQALLAGQWHAALRGTIAATPTGAEQERRP